MSILIKGMEMPTDRPQLLWVYPNGKALTLESDEDPWKELQADPVPQHNELIDAENCVAKILDLHRLVCEKINNAASHDVQMTAEGARIALIDCANIVKDMPAIIEAEE